MLQALLTNCVLFQNFTSRFYRLVPVLLVIVVCSYAKAQDNAENISPEENVETLMQLREKVRLGQPAQLPDGPMVSSEKGDSTSDSPYEDYLDTDYFDLFEKYGPAPFRQSLEMGMLDRDELQNFVAVAISNPEYGDRIAGGSVAASTDYPWQVALVNSRFGTLVCSGSHIGNGWIVTAAHCFYDIFGQKIGPENLLVRHGSNSLLLGNTGAISEGPFLHPNYDRSTKQNDIALLRFDPGDLEIVSIEYFEPPKLSDLPEKTIWVSGWGRVSPQGGISVQLLEVSIPVIPNSTCSTSLEDATTLSISASQICAGRLGGDSCNGDSGGPLSVRQEGRTTLVGVVSFGPNECGNGDPAIYTRVASYADWLTQLIQF